MAENTRSVASPLEVATLGHLTALTEAVVYLYEHATFRSGDGYETVRAGLLASLAALQEALIKALIERRRELDG